MAELCRMRTAPCIGEDWVRWFRSDPSAPYGEHAACVALHVNWRLISIRNDILHLQQCIEGPARLVDALQGPF